MRILTAWSYDEATKGWTIPRYSVGPWWLCALHWLGGRGMSLYVWADKRLEDEWDDEDSSTADAAWMVTRH